MLNVRQDPWISAMLIATCLATASVAVPVDGKQASNPPLRIVVLAGEDAVNVIQQRTAVTPLVEVRDRNNQPVAGAVVTFNYLGSTLFNTADTIGGVFTSGTTSTTVQLLRQ